MSHGGKLAARKAASAREAKSVASAQQCRLILLDNQEIVATRVPHGGAEIGLAIESIPRQDASRPVEAGNEHWRGGAFGFRFLTCVVKWRLGEDDAEVMHDRTKHMHGIFRLVGTGETTALRFAIEGDPVAATHRALRRRHWREAGGKGTGERERIELAKEALHRCLVGRDTIREAKRGKDGGGLTLAPLGEGEGEDGGEGKAATMRTTGIRDAGEGSEEIEGRKRGHRRPGCFRQGQRQRLHRALLCD